MIDFTPPKLDGGDALVLVRPDGNELHIPKGELFDALHTGIQDEGDFQEHGEGGSPELAAELHELAEWITVGNTALTDPGEGMFTVVAEGEALVGPQGDVELHTRPVTPPGPCTCRCNEGRHCGGCGHAGCGYRRDGRIMEPDEVQDRIEYPDRCEAHARKGTGTGTCDEALSPQGDCPNSWAHL